MPEVALKHHTAGANYYGHLLSRASEIVDIYRTRHPNAEKRFASAGKVFPGGYSRDAVMRDPFPIFVDHGVGSKLYDYDGHELTDFWFNATSLPLGHAHPDVVAAATAQVAKGSAFFGLTDGEIELAETLLERIPSAERIRFTNSGSEAVMMALRIARASTGRDLVIKFEGSYHGSYDDVQWSVAPDVSAAGDFKSPKSVADTPGLPSPDGRVLVLPYNDAEALRETLVRLGERVAAVLIEPMSNRIGLIMPSDDFIAAARAGASDCGAVLIFDEVIAFRLGYHGAQGTLGVNPDLTTLGKIIGGGFAVGAVAGRADILDVTAPGTKFRAKHAGTFNANPVTAAAGSATLAHLTPEAFDQMNAAGADIRARLNTMVSGLPLCITGAGSLFKISATAGPITNYRHAASGDKAWEKLFSLALLNRGFVLTTELQGCVSLVTSDADIDAFLGAVEEVLAE